MNAPRRGVSQWSTGQSSCGANYDALKPHARPAAVLGEELDADARHSGASNTPPRCQQPVNQQQKIQENKRSEKAKSPIRNARRAGVMNNNGERF